MVNICSDALSFINLINYETNLRCLQVSFSVKSIFVKFRSVSPLALTL